MRVKQFKRGNYVLATKYHDSDPSDGWCVGFFEEIYDHYGEPRYIVVDNDGKRFRYNGFRKAEKISAAEGEWLIKHMPCIDSCPMWIEKVNGEEQMCDRSVWDWLQEARESVKTSA